MGLPTLAMPPEGFTYVGYISVSPGFTNTEYACVSIIIIIIIINNYKVLFFNQS